MCSRDSISCCFLIRLSRASSLCKAVGFIAIAPHSAQRVDSLISPYGDIKIVLCRFPNVKLKLSYKKKRGGLDRQAGPPRFFLLWLFPLALSRSAGPARRALAHRLYEAVDP